MKLIASINDNCTCVLSLCAIKIRIFFIRKSDVLILSKRLDRQGCPSLPVSWGSRLLFPTERRYCLVGFALYWNLLYYLEQQGFYSPAIPLSYVPLYLTQNTV